MGRYILMATVNAHPGQEDEFNRWYDEEHLRDICRIPGIESGKRYVSDPSSPHATPGTFLAIYQLETDDPEAVIAEMGRRAKAREFTVSAALDSSSAKMRIYKAW